MAEHDIDKKLESKLNQLMTDKAVPVLTAEDFRFRVEHYVVPDEESQARLIATYGKAGRYFESDTLVKLEQVADMPDGPLPEATIASLGALLPVLATETVSSSMDAANLARLTEGLAGVQPLVWLQGFYYREAMYALPGYLVSIFYPAIGQDAKKRPITAFVRHSTEPVTRLVGTNLPPVVESTDVTVAGNRIVVNWSANHIGWGQFHFWDGDDGLIHCDNENMSRDFIKAVLDKVVHELEFDTIQVSPAAVTSTLGRILPGFALREGESFPVEAVKEALNVVVDKMVLEDG